MTKLRISGIICTHNRDNYLGAAIDSLLQQERDDFEFEIVVVDNASSDSTREVVQQRLEDKRLRYVYEPTLGLSVARNRGAKETTAPIIAYLDDDAVASAQWFCELIAAYDHNPKLAVAGGKVTLIWPEKTSQQPHWLSDPLTGALGAYDLGDTKVYIDKPGLTPRGLNYSLRRSFLTEIGGFDASLGRVGKKLLSNEELYVTELALKKGWQVAYLPKALVAHNVAPERIKPQWFLQRSWWQGVSECCREEIAGTIGIGCFSRGGERLLRGIYQTGKHLTHPGQRFENLVYAYGQVGYLTTAVATMLQAMKTKQQPPDE